MPTPAQLAAGLLVSSIGYVAFSYGKKAQRLPQRLIGLVLMVLPFFVGHAGNLLAVAGVLLGLMWLAVARFDL